MPLGIPSVKHQPEMPDYFQFKDNGYGVSNPLHSGWNSARSQLASNHPLESVLKNFRNDQFKINCSVMLHAQGPAAPLIQAMELRAVKQIGRHPFLPSSNFQLEVLTGQDMEMDFDDFLNTEEFKEVQAQPHITGCEKIKELEKENLEKNKILDLAGDREVIINPDGCKTVIPAEFPVLEISKPINVDRENLNDKPWAAEAQASDLKVFNMVEVMEKSAELLEELKELKVHNCHQSEIIGALKCQINQKEREIERLRRTLEGGRPLPSITSDFCFQCKQKEGKIKTLEEQLEAEVMKQHEAMSRALHLAERNQRLERELKDIDNMALAVEEECQNKVKQNLRNMDVLQEKLRQKIDEIKKLEETIKDMKNRIERDGRELDNLRTEKKLLENNLNLATNEKKNLNDRINHFLLIEKKLTSEILRLQEINKSLQRQIADMEERVMDVLGTGCRGRPKGRQKQQSHSLGISSSKTDSTLSTSTSKPLREEKQTCSDDCNFNDCFHLQSSANLLDKVQQERNFYHTECHRLKEILGNFHGHLDNSVDVMRQLKNQEREIKDLKQEAYTLRRENCALLKRFECGDHLSCSSGDSIKIILDRLEKERDMALSDISRLQGERDALKEKIKLATESQIGEQSRFERIVLENEERIRRLESERRELISNQSSQRITLAAMEEKVDEFKEQARNAQTELAQMTANYNQLKTLQEQTDRTLSDVQGRLSQTVIDLRFATNKIKELEKEKETLENEISVLKKEKCALKSSLTFMEKEKDDLLITLDEKTEKVAKLENQIKKQEVYVSELTDKISVLEKKFEFALNEKTNREHGLRTLERAVEHLKEELEQCERQKEAFIRENRRLQDDLASAAKDCLTARRELDTEKLEVENLKKQLQQYVSEVKRAEELLTKKRAFHTWNQPHHEAQDEPLATTEALRKGRVETERNQMLDHFRSLSLEATALETNNHTLESTVENTKTQLMSASNKIMDLEHQISSKDSLLYNYEKQIAELTTQIAELETKLKQQTDLKIRAETDLNALRDLCSAIDCQKEALRKQASSNDAEKTQLMNEVRRLSEEYEGLNQKLSYERSLSQTLEKSLSNSRQETLEHKITNKDLQMHVQQLRQKVDELTQKLESESQDVRKYQVQCAELSEQVSELRREVTNARFEQAKAMEDSRRNFPQMFDDGEDVKEIRFEEEILVRSARNIPPLTFPDDSDRTFSLESDREYVKLYCEEPGHTFRKLDWKLSPLLEKSVGRSKSDTLKADTTSELSSLPEDSETKNGFLKITASTSDDKFTDLSAYPTYSVHGRSDAQSRTYDACESCDRDKTDKGMGESFADEPLECQVGETTGGKICFPNEDIFFQVGTCFDCELEKSSQTSCEEKHEEIHQVTVPEIRLLPLRHSEPFSLEKNCKFQNCSEECG